MVNMITPIIGVNIGVKSLLINPLKGYVNSVTLRLNIMLRKLKEKREVKAKARKEAEGIFMKLNPDMAMKDGTFPKAKPGVTPRAYNKEAGRVQKQVVKTRVKQWKSKK